MPPQDTPPPPPPLVPKIHNPLAVMQPGEQTIFELKRHPIGIVITYIMTAGLLLALGVIAVVVAPSLSANGSSQQLKVFGSLGLLLFVAISMIFNLIATVVYWGNRWILTDDSITQMRQISLSRKETSSLGLEVLENVTVEQSGILTRIFNYGTIKAETAGVHSDFVFPFAPNPNHYAQLILEAHEKEQQEHNQQSPSNPPAPQYSDSSEAISSKQ